LLLFVLLGIFLTAFYIENQIPANFGKFFKNFYYSSEAALNPLF